MTGQGRLAGEHYNNSGRLALSCTTFVLYPNIYIQDTEDMLSKTDMSEDRGQLMLCSSMLSLKVHMREINLVHAVMKAHHGYAAMLLLGRAIAEATGRFAGGL